MIAWWRRLDRTAHLIVTAGLVLAALIVVAIVVSWDTYWAQYVIQNVFPPSVWTLVGIGISHVRTHRKLDAQHEALKQHVTATATTAVAVTEENK